MTLRTRPTSDFTRSLDFPNRGFGSWGTDIELFKEADEFLLSIEVPDFDLEDIEANWYEGRLPISAEHENDARGRQRTYYRSFQLPKAIEPVDIEASDQNGVLEVTWTFFEDATMRGQTIQVTG